MAERKPLVIVSGQIQQLQSGDTVAGIEVSKVTLGNNNAAAAVICTPVYSDAAAGCDFAQANAIGTSEVIGLVLAEIAIAGSGVIQTDGVMTATTGEWDIVTAEAGGLVADTIYWLDPDTPGKLTITPTSTDTELVVRVGKGLSTTQMLIAIQPPILL